MWRMNILFNWYIKINTNADYFEYIKDKLEKLSEYDKNRILENNEICDVLKNDKEFCLLYGEVAEAYQAWKKKKDDLQKYNNYNDVEKESKRKRLIRQNQCSN